MKNTILLLALLFVTVFMEAQTIPNSDFESWEQGLNFEEPAPWNTPNPITTWLSVLTVEKSEDAFSGSYSARLETRELEVGNTKYQVPGLLTYADFTFNALAGTYTFSGGVYKQEKVYKLRGKYKYQSVENDSASVLIYCFRHPEGEEFDTIGVGLTFLHDAADWSEFSVDMYYLNDRTPDTFNVLLMSTGTFEIGYMPPGSVLYVDNVTIDTIYNAIGTSEQLNAKHYPNPTSDKLVIELEDNKQDRVLKIFDINGRMSKELDFDGKKVIVDVRSLPAGIYTYQVRSGKEIPITGSFIKQ